MMVFFSKPVQTSTETFEQPKTVPINNPPQVLQQQSPEEQVQEPPSLFPDAAADPDPEA